MPEPKSPNGTIVVPGAVFLDPPGEVKEGMAVLVKSHTIDDVADVQTLEARHPGATVVELAGHILLPGLINTHVHLSFTASDDPRRDYYSDSPELRLARAIHNAGVMLQSGVTTLRDCGSDFHVLELKRIAKAGLFAMPNLLLSGPPITPTGGHLHQMGGEADGADEIRKLVRRLHKRGATSIKVMATGGQMTPGTMPERAAFTLEELEAIVKTASEFGYPTVAHVLATDGIRLAARAGFDSLEHCAFFEREEHGWLRRVYDVSVAAEVLDAGASAMIGVAAGYHTLDQARAGRPTEQEAFYLEQEQNMFEIVREFAEKGIPVVCGTDAGVKNTPFDETWHEVKLLVERAGFSPLEGLRTATVSAAHALRLDDVTGRIAPGMRADLIATAENPLVTPDALQEVAWIMRAGETVKELS